MLFEVISVVRMFEVILWWIKPILFLEFSYAEWNHQAIVRVKSYLKSDVSSLLVPLGDSYFSSEFPALLVRYKILIANVWIDEKKNGVLRRQCRNQSEIITKVWVLPKCESSYLMFRVKALLSDEGPSLKTLDNYSHISAVLKPFWLFHYGLMTLMIFTCLGIKCTVYWVLSIPWIDY